MFHAIVDCWSAIRECPRFFPQTDPNKISFQEKPILRLFYENFHVAVRFRSASTHSKRYCKILVHFALGFYSPVPVFASRQNPRTWDQVRLLWRRVSCVSFEIQFGFSTFWSLGFLSCGAFLLLAMRSHRGKELIATNGVLFAFSESLRVASLAFLHVRCPSSSSGGKFTLA